jgi:hypothetical protein
MKPRFQRWVLASTVAIVAAGCGESTPAEPRTASGGDALSSTTATSTVVGLVKRTERLPHQLTASRLIGPRGGHIEIGRAGMRIEFAPGAVKAPTRVTVTALRGDNVAYRFEPHGIQFSAPVVIRQSLRNTVAWKNPAVGAQLEGSYFERLLVDSSEAYARRLERRPARLRDGGRLVEFGIEHFSGYILSTGEVQVNVEVNIDISMR